jgi:hypothetical protein
MAPGVKSFGLRVDKSLINPIFNKNLVAISSRKPGSGAREGGFVNEVEKRLFARG